MIVDSVYFHAIEHSHELLCEPYIFVFIAYLYLLLIITHTCHIVQVFGCTASDCYLFFFFLFFICSLIAISPLCQNSTFRFAYSLECLFLYRRRQWVYLFSLEVCDSRHCILLDAKHIGRKVHQLTHILHASVSADKTCSVVTEVIIMQAFDILTIWSFNKSYNLQQCFHVRFWSVGNSILTPWQGISQIVQPNTYWSVFALRELP